VRGQYPRKYTSEWTASTEYISDNGQYPTECMTVVSVLNKINDSCQFAEQNTPQKAVSSRIQPDSEQSPVSDKFMTVARVSNKIYSQLPVCSTKYMTVASMSNKIHLTA